MSELHYGNSKGQLLGPYDPNEIRPQVRAQALLQQDGTEVWAIRANSREDALAKLDKASERGNDHNECLRRRPRDRGTASYRAWENLPVADPPRGPFTVAGEAELRERFQGMDQETARRLVDEADDGYAPETPDTLGRFVAELRDVMTGALETGAAYKVTRQDDGSYLVAETTRDERA